MRSQFLGVLILLTSVGARAESFVKDKLGLSGSVRAAEWERDKSFADDRFYSVGGFWLQARPQEFWGFKGFVDARVQGENLSRNTDLAADLREAFIEKSFGDFDFKLGRQITIWGRADKVNPTDVWSVKNLKLLTTDDEDQRTGSLASQIVYNKGNYRVIGIWQPEWREPKYPIPPIQGAGELTANKPSGLDQWELKSIRLADRWIGLCLLRGQLIEHPISDWKVGLHRESC